MIDTSTLHYNNRNSLKHSEVPQNPAKNNSIQNSVGTEENGYPVPDPKKAMINTTKEPSDAHKNTPKEEILQEITKKFMEKILDIVNQNIQDELRNFKTPKIKNMRRHKNK
jgi:hypothetical protein